VAKRNGAVRSAGASGVGLDGFPGAAVATYPANAMNPSLRERAAAEAADAVSNISASAASTKAEEDAEDAAAAASGVPAAALITPRAIYDKLNEHVIGQHKVKLALSVGVYNHYKRVFEAAKPSSKGVMVDERSETEAGATTRGAATAAGEPTPDGLNASGGNTGAETLSLEAARAHVRSSATVMPETT